MADKQFQCSGDCLKCHQIQRQYCASQNAYNTMKMLEDVMKEVTALRAEVNSMKANDDMLFSIKEKAQEGSGVKEIDSQESLTN